ncbi:MAG: peptide-methionine (S)-S-oxide reductase MsrA [Gemmatimonadetes bacterium]|nr:peptide-methionine (S)-S-oxide reductase MsrA [Gemmatimonadota bacterium]
MTIRPIPAALTALALLAGGLALRSAGADTARTLPEATDPTPLSAVAGRDSVIFAGGCFWGVEAVFERVKGVLEATSGYAGGHTANPTYYEVGSGATGHAEAVKVVYDPSVVSYDQLLRIFFSVVHDPTQRNRQGPDVGTEYRSAVYTASAAQLTATRDYIAQLTAAKAFSRPIVTEVDGWKTFWVAEDYHQGYYDLHPNQPYILINDKPKVAALQQEFPGLYVKK